MTCKPFEISAAALHILAMVLMLLDHIWATFPGMSSWMTCAGRLAFPIFAFLIAEGFFHTRSLKNYAIRLLVFAVISEVPFDLMYEGTSFNPFHNNVLWTFLIALGGMCAMERAKGSGKLWLTVTVDVLVIAATYLLGIVTFVDYNGTGVLAVYVFYFLRKRKWWCLLGQILLMCFINIKLISGYFYPLTIGGFEFDFPRQSLAVLALVPIWLYRGKQGYHSKPFQYFCYAFYPAHALILYVIANI